MLVEAFFKTCYILTWAYFYFSLSYMTLNTPINRYFTKHKMSHNEQVKNFIHRTQSFHLLHRACYMEHITIMSCRILVKMFLASNVCFVYIIYWFFNTHALDTVFVTF